LKSHRSRAPATPDPNTTKGSWPSFRGAQASGIAEGQNLPDQWNARTGENILWRTPIPGLAHSSPVVWGKPGTNGQHAYFQLLHQGPAIHPVDFILPLRAAHALEDQQRMLIANCLAQSSALMLGKTAQQVRAELQARGLQGAELEAAVPHRVFAGNRPSNTLLLPQLDAWHLGALLALYEHRTFVEGVIWNINSFDQWGVELGKQIATKLAGALSDAQAPVDAASAGIVAAWREMRGAS